MDTLPSPLDRPAASLSRRAPVPLSRGGWLSVAGALVAGMILLLGGLALYDGRRDVWRQAERSASNLGTALERDIARNIAIYDLSLQGALDVLRLPGIETVDPSIRHAAIFDRAATADYLGSILVLDAAGDIKFDSTSVIPHSLNLADRDYFQVHRDKADAGLFVSQPFRSRLRSGDSSMAITRRITGPDGSFQGVVVGSIRLAYFQALFDTLELGEGGSVTLLRTDGRIVARQPPGELETILTLGRSEPLRRAQVAPTGQFVAPSSLDGVERLFTYRRIADYPLLVVVALSVEKIYAPWLARAVLIGSLMLLLAIAVTLLSQLFRRELKRRITAETALVEAAGHLSVMAATDSLTGLANRRQFDQELAREATRAARDGASLSMVMIDADGFKAFNDRYGHPEGDRVLRTIAGCIRGVVQRQTDMAARYGGEEFAVLLPGTDLADAATLAERIRTAVRALDLENAQGPTGRVTVSAGVATIAPHRGEPPSAAASSLVRRADAALFDAKRAGRDRLAVDGQAAARVRAAHA